MHQSKADLDTVMYQNDIINYAYSRYLNHTPRFLTREMVEELANDCSVSTETAFLSLFSAACCLDPDTTPSHRTLEREYLRDKNAGLPIEVPKNYYPDDDDTKPPRVTWRGHANLLFSNWLNYYVYQTTPYEIGEI